MDIDASCRVYREPYKHLCTAKEPTQSVGQPASAFYDLTTLGYICYMLAIRLPFLTERYSHKISDSDQLSMNEQTETAFSALICRYDFTCTWYLYVHSYMIGLCLVQSF